MNHEYERRKERHPNEPWRWREDWDGGVLKCQPPTRLALQWVFGILLAGVAVLIAIHWKDVARDFKSYYFAGVTVLMAVAVLLPTLYTTVRWCRYRDMVCELHTNPGAIGGRLVATIRTPVTPTEIDSIETRLTCYYYDPDDGTDTGHGMRTELWREVQTIASQSLGADEQGNALIPVDFAIPSTCEASTAEQKSKRVQWELSIRGKSPGINLSAMYVVPVFHVAGEQAVPCVAYSAPDPRESRSPTIEVKACGDELEFHYVDNPLRILFALVFTIATVVPVAMPVYFYTSASMPLFMMIFFVIFAIPLLHTTLRLWFGRSHVHLSPTSLTEVSSMLGFSRRKAIPLGKIVLVDAQVDGRSGKTFYYAIRVHTESGVRLVLKGIRDKGEADGLVRRIEEYLVRYRSGAA